VVEGEQINEERTHLAGTKNENAQGYSFCVTYL